MNELLKNKNLSRVNQTSNTLLTLLIVLIILALLPLLITSCAGTDSTSSSTENTFTFSCDTAAITTDLTLQEIVESGEMPDLCTKGDEFSKTILTNFEVTTGTTLEARYATESGAGTQDGTSWANAWAATNLRNGINAIEDASESKVYLVLVAGGGYYPTTETDRTKYFSMKNYVGIVGGFAKSGGWDRTDTTFFSGDIGVSRNYADASYHVFYHDTLELDHALLYGVSVQSGYANGSDPHNKGGGMYNQGSSPRIINVSFRQNFGIEGGAMYNDDSSPRIINTDFAYSSKRSDVGEDLDGGGAIYNQSSSPVIINSLFYQNRANKGGGMYNNDSSPVIMNTVFLNNGANNNGGGMYNDDASSVELINTIFSTNIATESGAGMYNAASTVAIINSVFVLNRAEGSSTAPGAGIYHGGGETLSVYNTIFLDNTAPNSTSTSISDVTNDIGVDGTSAQSIRLVGSVLGVGKTTATNGIELDSGTTTPTITYFDLKNTGAGTITTAIFIEDYYDEYPTVSGGAGAKDLGVYVKKSGTTYYMSTDNSTWYTGVDTSGTFTTQASLPANAHELTATDFNGNTRNGRPDAGVIEE